MASLKITKSYVAQLILILLLGGLGGVLMDRVVLPYLSTLSVFRSVPLLNPQAPIVINHKEEIHIDEGINTADIISRVKGSLATVYVHDEDFTSPGFRLLQTLPGAVVTSDGIIAVPELGVQPNDLLTVLLPGLPAFPAKLLASDGLTGLSLIKIDATNLPVARQGLAADLQPGQSLLMLRSTEAAAGPSVNRLVVAQASAPPASLAQLYDLSHINAYLQTGGTLPAADAGSVVVNQDGLLTGFVVRSPKDGSEILRAEDLKLAIDNFLDDQKVAWPNLNLTYQIWGARQTALFALGHKNGILIKSGPLPLRAGDFVFAVDGKELGAADSFQEIVLAKHPGDAMQLSVVRAGSEKQLEVTIPR